VGGYGSGRWRGHVKATPVEDCQILETTKAMSLWGSRTWTNAHGGIVLAITCSLKRDESDDAVLHLHYVAPRSGKEMDYRVPMVSTRPYFGGLRRWFACPLCRRRASRLYLPPGMSHFGCRLCYRLTYRSCQVSHKPDHATQLARYWKALQEGRGRAN
jgi:hypothetical protein